MTWTLITLEPFYDDQRQQPAWGLVEWPGEEFDDALELASDLFINDGTLPLLLLRDDGGRYLAEAEILRQMDIEPYEDALEAE